MKHLWTSSTHTDFLVEGTIHLKVKHYRSSDPFTPRWFAVELENKLSDKFGVNNRVEIAYHSDSEEFWVTYRINNANIESYHKVPVGEFDYNQTIQDGIAWLKKRERTISTVFKDSIFVTDIEGTDCIPQEVVDKILEKRDSWEEQEEIMALDALCRDGVVPEEGVTLDNYLFVYLGLLKAGVV